MAIRVPVPRTGGYINMGDAIIYVTALLFGSVDGLVAGGIGSALADLIGGYSLFAPFTLVIKGLEGFLVGFLTQRAFRGPEPPSRTQLVLATVGIAAGGTFMIAGYFITEAYILRLGVGAAATELPGNIFQVVGGAVAALPIAMALAHLRPAAR